MVQLVASYYLTTDYSSRFHNFLRFLIMTNWKYFVHVLLANKKEMTPIH